MLALTIKKLAVLDRLTPETTAIWGKMTAQHMVEHLTLVFKLSRGGLQVKLPDETAATPRIKQLILLSEKPLQRNFVSPLIGEGLLPLQHTNLNEAKIALQQEVQLFIAHYTKHPDATQQHPVFGTLNLNEWEVFHHKHVVHHFTQFGLL